MRLIYGTRNTAKLEAMRRQVYSLPIEIVGLPADRDFPVVEERGADPLENAEIKARTYYQVLQRPVFSCDSGLFFDEAMPEDQPGTHVRRVRGKNLTDEEMIRYYAALSSKYGGRLTARYRNAICLIMDEEHIYRSMDDSLSGELFWLVCTPHPRRIEGFPLDSLSVDPNTERYYFDLTEKRIQGATMERAVADFFARIIQLRADPDTHDKQLLPELRNK